MASSATSPGPDILGKIRLRPRLSSVSPPVCEQSAGVPAAHQSSRLVSGRSTIWAAGNVDIGWAAKGSRPTVVRQNGRKSIWVLGIVDPATEWSMVSPHREANTATTHEFLNAAAKKLGRRQHAVMVLDRAGWHRVKQLTWPRRLTSLTTKLHDPPRPAPPGFFVRFAPEFREPRADVGPGCGFRARSSGISVAVVHT